MNFLLHIIRDASARLAPHHYRCCHRSRGYGFASQGDLAFNGASLYLAASNNWLVRIDLNNGAAGTPVGLIGFSAVFGLDTDSNGQLRAFSGTNVLSVDTSTGTGTFVFNYSGHGLQAANGASFPNVSVLPAACTPPDPGLIFTDNTGTFGAYEGVVKSAVLDQTTQAVVDIQGTILDLPLLPNRPLRFWTSIDSISFDPGVVTIAPNEVDAIGATFAELRLFAPGTHASFLANFCQPSTVDFHLGFNKRSAMLTIADVLVPIAGTSDIPVTASKVLAFANALSAIPRYKSAVNHMVSGFAAASKGRVRIASREIRKAGRDLVVLASNAKQRRKLLRAFRNLGFDLTARFIFKRLVRAPAGIVGKGTRKSTS